MGSYATRGSQGGKRRKIAMGAHGAGGKGRMASRKRSHSRCGRRDTIFVYRRMPLGVKGSVEWYISGIRAGIRAGTILSSIAFERTVPGGEVSSATSRVARKASRRRERSALLVNGDVHSNGSVVTIAELEGGEGKTSMSNSTVEIDAVNGVWGGSFSTSRGSITGDRSGAGEAVQAARPVSGDTPRTSISEGKKSEEESLDITQDRAGAPMW